jgi:predicted permease
MVKSFLRLRAVNPGFTAENVLTFDVSLNGNDYPNRLAALGFTEALFTRIKALPGVASVSAANCLPLTGGCWGDPMQIRGKPPRPGELPPLVHLRRTFPGFIETMKIPVLQGRTHVAADHQQRTGALVLSRRAAQLYFPNEDPIGKQLGFMFDPTAQNWYTVVGVVGDTPVENLGEKPYGVVYMPAIDPSSDTGAGLHNMAFTVRTTVPPMSLARAVSAAAAEVNPNVALGRIRSMEMIVSDATARMAFTMMLLLIAGGIALLLGAVGIYGVISYVVGQRTSEIGVRMALGAAPRDVAGMVLRQSGTVVGLGLLAGLAGALVLSRVMTSLLFQVKPTDAVTYTAVVAFLVLVAALASWLPARRAAAMDPLTALRK